MAAFAVGAELATMDIGVTVGAMRADVAEDKRGVALRAGNLLMHAAQRIASVIVVELGNGADRFPTRVCVAVLAGQVHRPVRVGYLGAGGRRRQLRGRA